MTGRGIDQVLPHPSDPEIFESYVKDARDYVQLAEEKNGAITKPVDFTYIWGDALTEFEYMKPDLRIINLETSITKNDDYWGRKPVNYRMNPKNMPCLIVAHIDCCTLANNHTIDWCYRGLSETIDTLNKAGIKSAGAGENVHLAQAPAILDAAGKGSVLVFSFGSPSSGVPLAWAAEEKNPGINMLEDFSRNTLEQIISLIRELKRNGDIVVFSVHWGDNWGYQIPAEQREFAHQLVDEAQVDLIHGHSSHHVKGIEVYKGKLVLYGCGDFLNDYEGIGGYENFRGDLGLMYFADVEPSSGRLVSLQMVPTQLRRFRINYASKADAEWLKIALSRESKKLGTDVMPKTNSTLTVMLG